MGINLDEQSLSLLAEMPK